MLDHLSMHLGWLVLRPASRTVPITLRPCHNKYGVLFILEHKIGTSSSAV